MAKRRRARRKEVAQPGVVATPKPRAEKTVVFVSLAIVAAVFIVYGQVATHNLTNLDDLKYLPQNYHVTTGLTAANIEWAFTKFYAAYWLPLTWISYMADVQMFGLDPGKILLVNVVLHALNSMFLFLVLRRATNELWRSATVAALFALHPLHVESVAWATERKDVLSTLFFMLTLLSYVLFVEKRSPARYLTMVVCFVLGMMAKPMVITIPFVLLLLDWWPLQRFSLENLRPLRQLIIEKIPLFVLVIPASLITMRAQREAIGSIPLGDRLKNALLSYLVYLGKTIWPANLSVIYPLRIVTGSVAVVAVVVLIAITIAALLGARRKYIPMGWFWYLGTLVPVIGIVQAGKQSMADRFTYIPLIGIFIAAVWL